MDAAQSLQQQCNTSNTITTNTTNSPVLIANTNTSTNRMSSVESRVMAAHNKCAHAPLSKLKSLIKSGTIPGIIGLSMSDLKKIKKLNCHSCAIAKMTRPPFSDHRTNDKVSRSLERISTAVIRYVHYQRIDPIIAMYQ